MKMPISNRMDHNEGLGGSHGATHVLMLQNRPNILALILIKNGVSCMSKATGPPLVWDALYYKTPM